MPSAMALDRPSALQIRMADRNAEDLRRMADQYARFLRQEQGLRHCSKAVQDSAAQTYNELCKRHSAARHRADLLSGLTLSLDTIQQTDEQAQLAHAYASVAVDTQRRLAGHQQLADDYEDAVHETTQLLDDFQHTMHTVAGAQLDGSANVNYFDELMNELQAPEQPVARATPLAA